MRSEPERPQPGNGFRLTPCGRTRREFLWEAGGGFAGTALTFLLAQDGFFGKTVHASPEESSPLAPGAPHFPPQARACIFLFMYGGPSQVDLWDPKPELTKRDGQPMPDMDADPLLKLRKNRLGGLMGSPFSFRKWGDSGIEVSELFPHQARHVDEMAVIRGTYADSFAHGSGLLQMNTGFLRQGHPSLGSWVTYGLGSENRNLPGYVVLLDHRGGPISGPPNWSSGFMPASYQGTQLRSEGDPILFLKPQEGVTPAQQTHQLRLLSRLNRMRGGAGSENDELMARIASYELAFRMQQAAPEAVDLARESKATRRRYGLEDPETEKFGRKCLIARRLVERGVRFIQVYSGGGHGDDTWDAHGRLVENHTLHCRQTDLPIAGLLKDLKSRGLLESTLVVWAGEFGRTPTSQGDRGRDHSPRGFTTWMAGGGVRGGQIIGATDDFGYEAVEDKVHVHDLHATILHLMGLDHELLTYFHGGREMSLTDVHGQVIRKALA